MSIEVCRRDGLMTTLWLSNVDRGLQERWLSDYVVAVQSIKVCRRDGLVTTENSTMTVNNTEE